MATTKQTQVVDKIVENHGNISKSMREVGYTDATAKNPKNLTNSKGFQQLCEERGLTDNFLVDALVEDIKKKPENRKPELELAFKVKGKLQDRQEGNKTLILNVIGESAQRYGVSRNTKDSST
jgi:hypothetical protein